MAIAPAARTPDQAKSSPPRSPRSPSAATRRPSWRMSPPPPASARARSTSTSPPRRTCSAPWCARRCCPTWKRPRRQFAAHAGSSADLLRVLAQRFLLLLDSDLTAVPKLVVAESGNFPAIAQFYADTVLRRAFGLVEGILTRGMERGEFRPMDVHATLPLFAGTVPAAGAVEALAGPPHRPRVRSARSRRGASRRAAARARTRSTPP